MSTVATGRAQGALCRGAFVTVPPSTSNRCRNIFHSSHRGYRQRRHAYENIEQGTSNDGTPSMGNLRYNQRTQLPEELKDLTVDDEGFLIDSKTGKVINEFGATRFDVLVRALRGELDPPCWIENTERNPGVLMGSLVQFPCNYTFNVVGKVATESNSGSFSASSSSSSSEADTLQDPTSDSSSSSNAADSSHPFVQDVVVVVGRCCQVDVPAEAVTVQQRLKGKYLSVSVTVRVRAPEIVAKVYEELGKDKRVTMKF